MKLKTILSKVLLFIMTIVTVSTLTVSGALAGAAKPSIDKACYDCFFPDLEVFYTNKGPRSSIHEVQISVNGNFSKKNLVKLNKKTTLTTTRKYDHKSSTFFNMSGATYGKNKRFLDLMNSKKNKNVRVRFRCIKYKDKHVKYRTQWSKPKAIKVQN